MEYGGAKQLLAEDSVACSGGLLAQPAHSLCIHIIAIVPPLES